MLRDFNLILETTKKLTNFVPYDSEHMRHTKNNLPKSLFDRAKTLNLEQEDLELANARIETGLQALGYPQKIVEN